MATNPEPRTGTSTSTHTNTAYWFKRRRYGYGWTPVRREGWLAIAGFVAALVIPAIILGDRIEETGGWFFAWLAWVLIAVLALIAMTARHAPKGKWRWGKKPDDDPILDI